MDTAGTVHNVRESGEGDGRCRERRGHERGEGPRREEGGRRKEGKTSYRQLATDRYVHDRTLRLPTLCFVLTHAGRRERSLFKQRMVLGNKKSDPSNLFDWRPTALSFKLRCRRWRWSWISPWDFVTSGAPALESGIPSSVVRLRVYTTSSLFLRLRAHHTAPRSASYAANVHLNANALGLQA